MLWGKKMISTNIKLQYPENPKELEIVLKVDRSRNNIQEVENLKKVIEDKKLLDVNIKQYRKKRSLDANAYCFVLCNKIAEVVGNTKEYVYKEMIKRVGQFEILPIKNEALESWQSKWEARGLGWQSIVMGESKLEGYTNTVNYFGSSVYDTKEFSILLNEIIYQAKELGIETITDTEKELLIQQWGEENGQK